MGLRSATCLLLIMLCAGPASGQHPLVKQKLMDLNAAAPPPAGEVVRAKIVEAAKAVYPDKPDCTAAGLTIEPLAPATAERSVFNGALSRHLRNGWTVIAHHPNCDDAPVRYMIVEDAAGALRTIRVNRGQSYAHESLIADTWRVAVMGVSAFLTRMKTPCEDWQSAKLGVTRVVEEQGLGPDILGVRYAGSWTEIWPVTMCGETIEIAIIFTADGDGGASYQIPGARITRVAGPAR